MASLTITMDVTVTIEHVHNSSTPNTPKATTNADAIEMLSVKTTRDAIASISKVPSVPAYKLPADSNLPFFNWESLDGTDAAKYSPHNSSLKLTAASDGSLSVSIFYRPVGGDAAMAGALPACKVLVTPRGSTTPAEWTAALLELAPVWDSVRRRSHDSRAREAKQVKKVLETVRRLELIGSGMQADARASNNGDGRRYDHHSTIRDSHVRGGNGRRDRYEREVGAMLGDGSSYRPSSSGSMRGEPTPPSPLAPVSASRWHDHEGGHGGGRGGGRADYEDWSPRSADMTPGRHQQHQHHRQGPYDGGVSPMMTSHRAPAASRWQPPPGYAGQHDRVAPTRGGGGGYPLNQPLTDRAGGAVGGASPYGPVYDGRHDHHNPPHSHHPQYRRDEFGNLYSYVGPAPSPIATGAATPGIEHVAHDDRLRRGGGGGGGGRPEYRHGGQSAPYHNPSMQQHQQLQQQQHWPPRNSQSSSPRSYDGSGGIEGAVNHHRRSSFGSHEGAGDHFDLANDAEERIAIQRYQQQQHQHHHHHPASLDRAASQHHPWSSGTHSYESSPRRGSADSSASLGHDVTAGRPGGPGGADVNVHPAWSRLTEHNLQGEPAPAADDRYRPTQRLTVSTSSSPAFGPPATSMGGPAASGGAVYRPSPSDRGYGYEGAREPNMFLAQHQQQVYPGYDRHPSSKSLPSYPRDRGLDHDDSGENHSFGALSVHASPILAGQAAAGHYGHQQQLHQQQSPYLQSANTAGAGRAGAGGSDELADRHLHQQQQQQQQVDPGLSMADVERRVSQLWPERDPEYTGASSRPADAAALSSQPGPAASSGATPAQAVGSRPSGTSHVGSDIVGPDLSPYVDALLSQIESSSTVTSVSSPLVGTATAAAAPGAGPIPMLPLFDLHGMTGDSLLGQLGSSFGSLRM